MVNAYTKTVQTLISELERLPGVGRKTAERLAYFILRSPADEALGLADAIRNVKKNVRHCRDCFNLTESDQCAICQDDSRERQTLCVVEQPKDLMAIEASGSFRGVYHVLLGAYAPLDGVEADALTVDALLRRLRGGEIREVILATNPTFEGEGTALFLHERLGGIRNVRVTRIARGVPSGARLEHVAKNIVADALDGRREIEESDEES